MTDERRKLLTEAMGEQWHTIEDSWGESYGPRNRTFTTPDDWEAVRVKIVMPNLEEFRPYLRSKMSIFDWIGSTPEQCCELVADFLEGRDG